MGKSEESQMPSIFLSFVTEDEQAVERLNETLSKWGCKPWKQRLPGQTHEASMKVLKESHFFIACLSKEYVGARGQSEKEINAALDCWKEKKADDIYLIPARLADCEVPDKLDTFQRVDLFGKNEKSGWEALKKAIKTGAERLDLDFNPTEHAAVTPTEQEEDSKADFDSTGPSSAVKAKNSTVPELSLKAGETTVVLIGTSEFSKDSDLESLPAVKNNVRDLKATLCNNDIVGLRDTDIHEILDEAKASDVLTKLAGYCNEAQGTLIVYYAGHGLVCKGPQGSNELYLATRETTDKFAKYNAVPFEKVRSAVDDSEATKKILIVDSCFSGKIIDAMSSKSSLLQANLEFDEVFSIASASNRQTALAPSDAEHTVFTGEMIKALNKGLDNKKEVINLKDLFEHIKRNLKKQGAPQPKSYNMQNAETIVLARNRKYDPSKATVAPEDEGVIGTGDSSETKQLKGIVDILYHCHKLLRNAVKAGGNLWLAATTYAFGPAHDIFAVWEEWSKRYGKEGVIFQRVSYEFNEYLEALLGGTRKYSSKVYMVTLKKELLLSKFINKLYKKKDYDAHVKRNPEHLNQVEREILETQESVEDSAKRKKYILAYVDDIYWQAIVTDIERNGDRKKACVAFSVGTHNIDSVEPTGYYSEDQGKCKVLMDRIEKLYQEARNRNNDES